MEQSGLDSKKAPKVASQLRVCNPFSTAVPTLGQTTQIPSGLSPKRDYSSKWVKACSDHVFLAGGPGPYCCIPAMYTRKIALFSRVDFPDEFFRKGKRRGHGLGRSHRDISPYAMTRHVVDFLRCQEKASVGTALSHHPCVVLSTRVLLYHPVCYIITRVLR